MNSKKKSKSYSSQYTQVKIKKRKCHDCGAPTTDYRCSKCLKAWRLKNGIPVGKHGELLDDYNFFL